MAEKIEVHKVEFLTIRPNHKAETDPKAESFEYSGKIGPTDIFCQKLCYDVLIEKFTIQKTQYFNSELT